MKCLLHTKLGVVEFLQTIFPLIKKSPRLSFMNTQLSEYSRSIFVVFFLQFSRAVMEFREDLFIPVRFRVQAHLHTKMCYSCVAFICQFTLAGRSRFYCDFFSYLYIRTCGDNGARLFWLLPFRYQSPWKASCFQISARFTWNGAEMAQKSTKLEKWTDRSALNFTSNIESYQMWINYMEQNTHNINYKTPTHFNNQKL